MPVEPQVKRAIAFFDGQNLYHCAKAAFGYTFPNYDPLKLAHAVCAQQGWALEAVRFYTGVPDHGDNAFWHHFWTAKGAQMGRQGVHVCTRPLRYRNKRIKLLDGREHTFLDGDEKGIDVRLAIDVIRLAPKSPFADRSSRRVAGGNHPLPAYIISFPMFIYMSSPGPGSEGWRSSYVTRRGLPRPGECCDATTGIWKQGYAHGII